MRLFAFYPMECQGHIACMDILSDFHSHVSRTSAAQMVEDGAR